MNSLEGRTEGADELFQALVLLRTRRLYIARIV